MSPRRINFRLLFITSVAFVVIAGGVVFAHSWQLSKTAQSLLTHAVTQEEQQEWLKAAEYLDRYLRIEPGDQEARVKLATDYAKGAQTPEQKLRAVDLHYKALSIGGLKEERMLRERLAELLLETGRLLEAENEAKKLLESERNSRVANRLLALSLFRQYVNGDLAKADLKTLGLVTVVEKANLLNPQDVSLAVVQATLYREHPRVVAVERPSISPEERIKLADACLNRLVQSNPKSATVYLTRSIYRTKYKLDGSQNDLDEALRLAPNDAVVLRTVAFAALVEAQRSTTAGSAADAAPHYRRAKELLEKLMSKQPRQATPEVFLGLGEAHLGLGDTKRAFESWHDGLRTFVQPTVVAQFHARMADAYMDHKDLSLAKESLDAIDQILEDIGTSIPRSEALALMRHQRLRKASWLLRRDELAEAITLLRQIVGEHSAADVDVVVNANAWMLLGVAYSSTGEWGEAAQAFDRVVIFQPSAAAARIAAASAWLNAGRNDLALDRAQNGLRDPATLGAKETLEARLVLATCFFRLEMGRPKKSRDWTKFKKSLEELELAQPSAALVKAPWQIDFLRAEFEFNQPLVKEEIKRAREIAAGILQLAENKYAESAEFLSQLCLLFEQFDLPKEADRVLARLREMRGQPLIAAVTSARLAVARKQFDLAVKELDQVEAKLSAAELRGLLEERISIALAKRDLALAHSLLLRQLERNPRDLSVIRRLADIDLERREMKLLEKWEQSLAELGSLGQPLYLYYHACRLIFSHGPEHDARLREALSAQERLANLRPEWSETYALRGMLEQERGHREQAVVAYERAIELGEPRLYVFERLITLLEALNRGNDAEKYVSRLQLEMPRSQQLTELASKQHLRQFRPDYAITTARLAVEDRPDDASAHAWLGRMLLLGNSTGESEKEFSKALELAPHDVSSWHGLFSFYVRIGAKDKARVVLNNLAEKAQLGEADRLFVLGQGYELLGDVETAVRFYKEAADNSPASSPVQLRMAGVLLRSDPRQAEVCLRKAIQLDPQDPTGRRMLAALLASRGTDAEFQEAESLLKGFAADDLVTVEDQRLRALLFSQKGGQEGITRAAELVEELLRGPNSVTGDRLFLAQLYEFQARTIIDSKARQAKLKLAKNQLLAVASPPEADLRHLSAIIEFLARTHEEAELPKWFKRYEEKLVAAPQDQADPIAAFLLLQIRLKKTDGCELWLQRLEKVDKHPVRPLALRAKILIAKGQQREALQLINTMGAKRVEAAADNREKLLVYQGLGDLLFGLDEFSGAESWYRLLLAADPTRFEYLVAALAKQKKHPEVLRLCEDAAKAQAGSKPAIVLGNTIFETAWTAEHLKQADPIINTALERFPRDPGLLYTAGLVRIVQDRSDDAVALFRELVRLEPRDVAALNNLALLLADRPSERKEALMLIDRAIEFAGMEPSLLDTKGTILVHDGQAPKGVSLLLSAANSQNVDPRYRLHLALAYRETGDFTKAKQELTRALNQKIEALLLTASDSRLLNELKTTLTNN